MPASFGRYAVQSILGEGAFGRVYLGLDSQLNRYVAIKVAHVGKSSGEVEQEFLIEARQLAQLKHPGIVAVYDVGVQGDQCYIVSDYLQGESLHAWLQANQLSWQQAVYIVATIADALGHAHAQRVVHRDLKPENVIMTEGGQPVIVDFGLSVSEVKDTASDRGMVSGTPAYMSPEQARGEGHRIDGRTDVYAMGVMLYRMLTGRLPFASDNIQELLRQVQDDEPQPPRQLVPTIPRELEAICLKAMSKQITDRYTTAADMAEGLRQILNLPAGVGQYGQPAPFQPPAYPGQPVAPPGQPFGQPVQPGMPDVQRSAPTVQPGAVPAQPYGQPAQPGVPDAQRSAPTVQPGTVPAQPYGQPAQPGVPDAQRSAPTILPGSVPGQPMAPPGQGYPPGQAYAPPAQPGWDAQPSAPPAQASAPPTQPGWSTQPSVPPGQAYAPSAQPGWGAQPSAPPGQTYTPPTPPAVSGVQPSVPPGQASTPPAQPGSTAQPPVPPGQAYAPPAQPGWGAQPSAPPGQAYAPPAQPGGSGVQPSVAPGQPSVPPGQPYAPPAQPHGVPGQPVAPPAQPMPTAPPLPSDPTPSAVRRAREAERRRVTVVHCGSDLFDSDAILETLDEEEQEEVLVEYQQLCREAAEELEGTVVQSTDSGLLVCFGYPVAFEDSTRRAVRAGLTVLEKMAPFNERLRAQRDVSLSASVAIHSDLAVVKAKGGRGDALSIVGPVLRVAQQLEGLAEPGTIAVSDDTYQLIKGFFECESLGSQRIKGMTGEREVHQVLSERKAGSRVDAAEAASLTPLIGRDREVGLLQERWEQAAEGMGQVVLLIGEAGLGKSRLVHVLKEHVIEQNTADGDPIIEWRSSPQHQTSSLYPPTECFERVLGLSREDSAEDKLGKLVDHLTALNLDGHEEVALLASLLSIPLNGHYPALNLNPQLQKDKALDLLLDWLKECSYKLPVLFVVEDLHWVDPTTLEFLEALVDQGLNDSILTLLTFRPEFETPWRSKAHQTQVALNRLTKRQIGEMMVSQTGLQKIPQHVVDQVVERTDGVPLFVEEFTTMVLESEGVREVDGKMHISDSFPVHEIPATLQDLLMARLDRMASNIEVAQLGATIGREFTYELASAVSSLTEQELQAELAKLVEAELLLQRGRPPRTRYTFKHALIQDAAYQSLLKKERQQFHRQIGETLEQQHPETIDSQPELLAHHFTEANVAGKAVAYWDRAGERDVGRGAHLEAVTHLTKGLELLQTLPESPDRDQLEVRMQISLGVPLQSTRGYGAPEVQEVYARARELCHKMGDSMQLFPVLYGLFRSQMLRAEYVSAEELGRQIHDLAEKSGKPVFVVAANRALGSTQFYQGKYASSMPHLEKVISIAATPEDRAEAYTYDVVDPWITSRSYRTWTLWLLGYPEQARSESLETVSTAQGVNHPFSLALALSFASWLDQFSRDVELTRETAEEALEMADEHGFAFWIGWAEVLLGWVRSEEGQHEEAIELIRKGLVDWRAQGSELGRTYFLALLAEAYGRAGKPNGGLEALDEAQEFAKATAEAYWDPEIHRLRGELLLQQDPGAAQAAEACLQQALNTARGQGAKSLELRAVMSMARLWRDQGRTGDARALLGDTYGWFTEGHDTHDLKAARALLDELG